MIRVLLADDHPLVRQGVRSVVDRQPDMRVIGEAGDVAALDAWLSRSDVDVLVLDLSLPGVSSGLDLTRRVRRAAPALPIVIFTMYAEDVLGLHLLREGALAYLSKDRAPDELLRAVRKAARRERYVTDRLADLAVSRGPAEEQPPHQTLTPREYQVFLLLLQGRAPTEIAQELALNPSTVSNHLAHLREKLGATSNADVLRYAHRVGLLD
jgi:DNA-binding NarL/FixJ family response regulator